MASLRGATMHLLAGTAAAVLSVARLLGGGLALIAVAQLTDAQLHGTQFARMVGPCSDPTSLLSKVLVHGTTCSN
jgi:hypothetical protein